MPGLPRHQSFELMRDMGSTHGPGIMRLAPLPKPLPRLDSVDGIKYIPAQQDPMAASTTSAARQSPIRLFFEDAGVLLRLLPYLPNIFLPLKTKNSTNELYLHLAGARDMLLQIWLFIMEAILLLLAVPVFLVLPGLVSLAGLALSCWTIWLTAKPMEGPRIAYSNMNDDTLVIAEQRKDERWLFVNGCAVAHSGLQKNIDRLAETFGRAVIGIHNVTYGLPADLLECLIQRCFAYSGTDVRVSHSYVKATLVDPTVSKVVLIGHSQGGIIISLVIDQLFTELPASCMSKLEIYTFGSAASHFSNPLASVTSKTVADNLPLSPTKVHFDRPTQPKHVISHIEHYANERDMVPRWGVLHCVQDVLNNRYAGSVFVRMGASGHMFNQHYMDPMFPLSEKEVQLSADGFLDKLVKVEEKLAMQRESTSFSNIGLMRKKSGLEFGDGQIIPEEPSLTDGPAVDGIKGTGDAFMTFARTNSGRLMAEEAQGKTVRELSRLWRYQGGRSPHTPTPFPAASPGDHLMGGANGGNDKLERPSYLTTDGREQDGSKPIP